MSNKETITKAIEYLNWYFTQDNGTADKDAVKAWEISSRELEPVRCKDCKLRGDTILCPLAYIEETEQFTAICTDEWFCGNGKRR